MIDGVEIISAGTDETWLGILLGIVMVFAILIFAFETVISIKECRGDKALALAICVATLIVSFNPIMEMEQLKDGTLVLKEKQINGKS